MTPDSATNPVLPRRSAMPRPLLLLAAVLPGAKPGEVIRVECAASSLDWAARTLIWKHLIHDPASTHGA